MKQFVLFEFYEYYPSGGLADVSGSYDTLEEAEQKYNESEAEYCYIVDRDTWQVIKEK